MMWCIVSRCYVLSIVSRLNQCYDAVHCVTLLPQFLKNEGVSTSLTLCAGVIEGERGLDVLAGDKCLPALSFAS